MQIFVLGMHRSGTSVVTRLINLMGAYFGPVELSTGANPENPKGFWERRDVRDTNDAVLWSTGAEWWKVAEFTPERVPARARRQFFRDASKIVSELDAHRPWVVKEPRLCLLFPMWRQLVKSPVCVLVHRSPVQVAHSLRHRNGFPLSFGIALWERYVRDALAASVGLPRVIVSYEQIMADPGVQARQLFEKLKERGTEALHLPSEVEIESFVSADLFHHRHPVDDQGDLLSSEQQQLVNAMERGAALELDEIPPLSEQAEAELRLFEEVSRDSDAVDESTEGPSTPDIGPRSPRGRKLQPSSDLPTLRGRAMAYLAMSKNLRDHFNQLEKENVRLRRRAGSDRREIESLHAQLEKTEKALDRARSNSRSRGRRLKLLQSDVESSQEGITLLETRCRALEKSLAKASSKHKLLEDRLAALKMTLSEAQAERKKLETQRTSAKEEISHLEGKLGTAQEELSRAVRRVSDLEPQAERLRETLAALDREGVRVSHLEARISQLESGLTTWRSKIETAESRQHELERSIQELLVFLRRSQDLSEGFTDERASRFGPFELRSYRHASSRRNHLRSLWTEVGNWVEAHRDQLIEMIQSRDENGDGHREGIFPRPIKSKDFDNLSIDVIVCVHDSLDEVRRCLDSVIPTIGDRHTLILVDDGSGAETAEYLGHVAATHERVTLVRRDIAGGYTKAANSGIAISSAEFVVLLNSDTQVPSTWLKKLARAAFASTDIGIVGPLSNAASWQSVPKIVDDNGRLAVNEMPGVLTVDVMDRIAALCSKGPLPRVSLANGFCFAIKRTVLDTIGRFDEDSFPQGYGEENDFCFRAADAGFDVVIATDCYVFHEKSKSYSPEVRDQLAKKSGEALGGKYPAERIRRAVEECKTNPILVDIRRQFGRLIDEVSERRARWMDSGHTKKEYPRILFILPVSGGGGGVHSIVQESMGIRELGGHAAVAVPARVVHRYHENYPSIDPSVFVGFNHEEDLIAKATDYDVVVATIFTSVKMVKKIVDAAPHLVPAYYIQDYEPWICRDGEPLQKEALASYQLVHDMIRFAKTDWICRTVEERHGVTVRKVMPSLDTSVYYPPSKPTLGENDGQPVRIAAMVRPKTPRRAAALTMEVLCTIKKQYGRSVDIQLFGCNPGGKRFLALCRDFEYRHLGILLREEVADALRSSDVFVDFSTYQAFGRTALEAMACGCAVIVPARGGTSEYAEHGANALVVDTSDKHACLVATGRLIEDRGLRDQLARGAETTAARYSIRGAAESLLAVLSGAIDDRRNT